MGAVVIIGAGGHAKVIIDILRAQKIHELVGCTCVDPDVKEILGLRVLGDDSVLPQLHKDGARCAFVAIGDNALRRKLSEQALQQGFELVAAISPNAYISETARLGIGIAIMPGVVINPDAVVGDFAIINTGTTIDHDCIIGPASHICPGCTLSGNVTVGTGVFLGTGCKAIPKVSIGDWATVGAGAVVINDIPARSTAVGVPAKVIKRLNRG